MTHANDSDFYGSPDSLISKGHPVLHVANFSPSPVVIAAHQVLGIGRNPKAWLDRIQKYSPEDQTRIELHGRFVRHLVEANEGRITRVPVRSDAAGDLVPITEPGRLAADQSADQSAVQMAKSETKITSKAHRNATDNDDPLAEEPIEGGPKTSEAPSDNISSDQLLLELDISPDISSDQRRRVEEVILKNKMVFSLDGRLGNYEGRVDIAMKPGAQPVSLPPFPVSPANREVIDKQMDSWISLGVIEPSKSPWAAPVFIVYRNGKPRMVIDLRRLNEMVIPDEFPLPKQDDILQTLTGAQWLTTLDALSGFTQLTMTDAAAEKLAFRTHRGLWQFRRMPFGYRNGPSVFQRVL